jgi:hypothetical protein
MAAISTRAIPPCYQYNVLFLFVLQFAAALQVIASLKISLVGNSTACERSKKSPEVIRA